MGTAIRVILLWWWAWPFWLVWHVFDIFVVERIEKRRLREHQERRNAEHNHWLWIRLCPECRHLGVPSRSSAWVGCPRCAR